MLFSNQKSYRPAKSRRGSAKTKYHERRLAAAEGGCRWLSCEIGDGVVINGEETAKCCSYIEEGVAAWRRWGVVGSNRAADICRRLRRGWLLGGSAWRRNVINIIFSNGSSMPGRGVNIMACNVIVFNRMQWRPIRLMANGLYRLYYIWSTPYSSLLVPLTGWLLVTGLWLQMT